MTSVPEINHKLAYKIPVGASSEVGTKTAFKAIRSAEIKLKEKQLLWAEKDRLGEDEYQRRLVERMRYNGYV